MSEHSKAKGEFLRSLNLNKDYLLKRRASRCFHEDMVVKLVGTLSCWAPRRFILSEYVKEDRRPDAIVFDGQKLNALEVELEKKYKASHAAILGRLSELNARPGFFHETYVLFVQSGETAAGSVAKALSDFTSKD